MRRALIFDCDGVLVDTERDGHRVAFNTAFRAAGLDIEWDVPFYSKMLQVAGGKERIRAYFDDTGWPEHARDRDAFVKDLHRVKSDAFLDLMKEGSLSLRPGVSRFVDRALALNMQLAVCSTSKLESVESCVALLGHERASQFTAVLAGDIVSRKKPDPEIYLLAQEKLNVAADECLVIEDSEIGCAAAVAAGCRCVVTTSAYTAEEDFAGAYRVLPELGDGEGSVSLDELIGE
ncbi:MAG: HAD-IA family hydrolase [Pseudomonadota bacterium]